MTPEPNKICPRCQSGFRCQPEHIDICQCSTVSISPGTRSQISAAYTGCLCAQCLQQLENEQATAPQPQKA